MHEIALSLVVEDRDVLEKSRPRTEIRVRLHSREIVPALILPPNAHDLGDSMSLFY